MKPKWGKNVPGNTPSGHGNQHAQYKGWLLAPRVLGNCPSLTQACVWNFVLFNKPFSGCWGWEELGKCFITQHPLDHRFPKLCWEDQEQISPHLTVLHYWSPSNNQNKPFQFPSQRKPVKISNSERQPKDHAVQQSGRLSFTVKVLKTMPLHL